MNVILDLFFTFFKIGLFAVGGGPATLPYLMELTKTKDWYTMQDLTNMIAISESTPGPLGLNMSTYAGFQTLGLLGGVVSTLGLVIPSVIIICLIAKFLDNFSKNKYVQGAFKGIRPVVTAVIAVAVLNVIQVSLFTQTETKWIVNWGSVVIAVVVFGLLQIKKLNKFHPALWFLIGAIIGLVFQL